MAIAASFCIAASLAGAAAPLAFYTLVIVRGHPDGRARFNHRNKHRARAPWL